jgi:hypothetical protein
VKAGAASVQMSVHVVVPAGAYWNFTLATSEPTSVAVAVRATVFWIGVATGPRVTPVGTPLSIRRELTGAEAPVLATPSIATARKS